MSVAFPVVSMKLILIIMLIIKTHKIKTYYKTNPKSNLILEVHSMEIKIQEPIVELERTISVSDFGASPFVEDNSEAFYNAIEYCREIEATKLLIPKGVYRIYYKNAFVFRGLKDFTLEGSDSELIIVENQSVQIDNVISYEHRYVFLFDKCERCVVKNLYIDWDWEKSRLATLGKILEVAQDYFDMIFEDLQDIDPNIRWVTFNSYDPISLTPGVEGGKEYWLSPNNFKQVIKTSNNVLRVFPDKMSDFPVKKDELYLVRHYTYDLHGFNIKDVENFSFKEVVIYSVPGMGYVVSGDSHHFELQYCKIVQRPATKRYITACADGFHMCQSKGYFKIEHCDFSFMGDDAINIHDNNALILEKVHEDTLIIRDTILVQVGDTIELRNSDLSKTNFCSKITHIEGDTYNHTYMIQLQDHIPEEVQKGCIVFNQRYSSDHYIVKNNYFHENRARGILLHNSSGIIENNYFYKTQGAAIQIETGVQEKSWSEGTGVENLWVVNNVFDTCNVNDWAYQTIIFISTYLPNGRTNYPIFKNLYFHKNCFINFPSRAFFITSCDHVEIRDNIFSNITARVHSNDLRGSLYIEKSTCIEIRNNLWVTSQYILQVGKIDADNTSSYYAE